jgi:hypothetical protein
MVLAAEVCLTDRGADTWHTELTDWEISTASRLEPFTIRCHDNEATTIG